jgi:hypothetical protein
VRRWKCRDVPVDDTRRRIHSQGRKDRIRARDNVLLITSTLLLLLNKYSEIFKGKATCFCPRKFFFLSPSYVCDAMKMNITQVMIA